MKLHLRFFRNVDLCNRVGFTEMDEHGNLVKRVRKKGERDDDEESLYDYVSS